MLKLLAVVGPTATGKSYLAVDIAEKLNGEIISCDSMQIYKGLDIGSGKLTPEERKNVLHHMLDIADIGENYSVAQFAEAARQLIEEINSRGKIPVLAGGTGLYYQAVVDNYEFFSLEKKKDVRHKWEKIISDKGLDDVYAELLKTDPDYASKISAKDKKRIVRALEVYELTGKPFSKQRKKTDMNYDLLAIGLNAERRELYERINRRVDRMLEQGLLDEVLALMERGYDLENNAMHALGYKQALYYCKGLAGYEETVAAVKKETRNYAKRQLTWFKKDKRIQWINVDNSDDRESIFRKFYRLWEGHTISA
ncbi:MAG: tRNA (adenosine(37)-N6)-dimethylallyltransferase MiaA [Syntrophomonadaceae bacterium]|jgi:tRNA dimethylallyltransferase|nr:tRNA (adenosine(37)-N6)-dimethylallyltransferase MiaA [Syntrophomonadaceae bacterium]